MFYCYFLCSFWLFFVFVFASISSKLIEFQHFTSRSGSRLIVQRKGGVGKIVDNDSSRNCNYIFDQFIESSCQLARNLPYISSDDITSCLLSSFSSYIALIPIAGHWESMPNCFYGKSVRAGLFDVSFDRLHVKGCIRLV